MLSTFYTHPIPTTPVNSFVISILLTQNSLVSCPFVWFHPSTTCNIPSLRFLPISLFNMPFSDPHIKAADVQWLCGDKILWPSLSTSWKGRWVRVKSIKQATIYLDVFDTDLPFMTKRRLDLFSSDTLNAIGVSCEGPWLIKRVKQLK